MMRAHECKRREQSCAGVGWRGDKETEQVRQGRSGDGREEEKRGRQPYLSTQTTKKLLAILLGECLFLKMDHLEHEKSR